MTPNVSLHVVTWNGERYLPDLLGSIEKQRVENLTVRVVDNASDDGTIDLLSRYPLTLVRNARNLGFGVAHNQLMRLAIDKWKDEDLNHCYIVVANQDMILTPGAVNELVEGMERYPDAGSAQGKLRKAFIEHPEDDYLTETVCADIIDSTGLKPSRSRTFTDRGAGEMDAGQYDKEEYIFGPTGAFAIYRASALESVRMNDAFFDADYFMYREDVDLAWRLRLAGWESVYFPKSEVFHYRGLYAPEKQGIFERIQARRKKRPVLATLSTRNQYFTLYKNLGILEGLVALPAIVFVHLRQLVYSFFFEPHVIRGLVAGLTLLPKMTRKRRVIQSQSKRRFQERHQWFN